MQHFPPAAATAPPVPTGEWSIIVDADCKRVTNRPAEMGDMLARQPVPYAFGGTQPPFKNDPKLGIEQNAQKLVDYECRAARNKEFLEQAVFILSQTNDGRRLLQKARQEKFTLVFDDERVAEVGAVGLCDYSKKEIPLAEGRSVNEVVLTLKHELQHMDDISEGLGYSHHDTPRNGQMVQRALEGNARVSEAVAAAEALLGAPEGPPQQFRTAALFNDLWHKLPKMAKEMNAALPLAEKKDWTGFAAKVLPAFYAERDTLNFYDKYYADNMKRHAPDVGFDVQRLASKTATWQERDESQKRLDWFKHDATTLFNNDTVTPAQVTNALHICNQPYGAKLGGFDVGSDAALASAPSMKVHFDTLKANIAVLIPGSDKGKLLDLPALEKEPVAEKATASPYGQFRTKTEIAADTFQPLKQPDRIDSAQGRLTTGETINSFVTTRFAGELGEMKSGKTELDRVNYTIMMQLTDGRRTGNLKGAVSGLIDAGLRAPIGAFPQEYLQDLYGRIRMAQQSGATGDRSPVTRSELKLLEHWQEMKEKGLDPVFIDKQTKEQSWVARNDQILHYAAHIQRLLPGEDVKPPRPALYSQRAMKV